jgi:hypothetical protein
MTPRHVPFRRILPIANVVACLLFVLLREPASSAYLAEVDDARQRGGFVLDDAVWGTLACRTLHAWSPYHAGEELGVAALEVLNLPSLMATGITGFFADAFGVARMTSACRWSWMLAAVFMALASAQWWYIGRAIDRRGGRLTINPLWVAYVVAPFGVLPVAAGFQMSYAIAEGVTIRSTGFLTATLVVTYFFGLFMLPVWWIFEKLGWAGWRYYVPTGACVGLLLAFVLPGGGNWEGYVLFGLSGTFCAIVFSAALAKAER